MSNTGGGSERLQETDDAPYFTLRCDSSYVSVHVFYYALNFGILH